MSWDISLGVGWRGRKTIFFKICFICDKTVNSRNNPKPKVNRLAIDFQTAQRMDWSEGSAILHSTSTKNIYFQLVKNVKWNANFIHLNSFLSFFYCTWTSVSLTFFSLKHKLKGFNLNLPPPPSGQCVLLPVQWNILFPVVVARSGLRRGGCGHSGCGQISAGDRERLPGILPPPDQRRADEMGESAHGGVRCSRTFLSLSKAAVWL